MTNELIEKIAINQNELLQLCMGINKSTFIHLLYECPLKLNKTGNPYVGTTKVVSGNFLTGNDYEKRVITNGEKEGIESTFVAEKPKGKTHIAKCVLQMDNDNSVKYLMYEYFKDTNVKVVEYRFNGGTIEKQLFEAYMTKVVESNNKQPQEKKVFPRTITLSNIKEMTLNGVKYIVE
jgi:hypothetical protein